jgi:hypothetical protein
MEQQQKMNLNVDLQNTQVVETKEGNVVFQQGVILRRVSKFVVGADEDAVMPIPVFYDPITGKILKDTIPAELRKDYEDHIING